ncbi:hypothetical protein SLA2020_444940 [Shorea laevis]
MAKTTKRASPSRIKLPQPVEANSPTCNKQNCKGFTNKSIYQRRPFYELAARIIFPEASVITTTTIEIEMTLNCNIKITLETARWREKSERKQDITPPSHKMKLQSGRNPRNGFGRLGWTPSCTGISGPLNTIQSQSCKQLKLFYFRSKNS